MLSQDLKLGHRQVELLPCLIHRELVRLQLDFRQIALGRKLPAVSKILLGPTEVFPSHEFGALHLFLLLTERPREILVEGKPGGGHFRLGLDEGSPGLVD